VIFFGRRPPLLAAALLAVLLALPALPAAAQSTTQGVAFDMTGFPQWTRDLRRAEIVAFGSFPFAYFFATFAFDTFRLATHDWDSQYAPWPAKPAGAPGYSDDEQTTLITVAAGGAIFVAAVDCVIELVKRYKAAAEARKLPAGTPIITRRPIDADADADAP